jgi:crotonobetaine/carnitine-CoA ligase
MSDLTNIAELIDVSARRSPGNAWVVAPSGTLSCAEMAELVETAARGFAELGVAAGDRVLTEMPNVPGSIALWLGMARLGAALVPFNPGSTEGEFARLAQRAQPALVVSSRPDLPGTWVVVPANEVHTRGASSTSPAARQANAADPVVLIPTSGTTSAPKLVMQSHRSFLLAAEAFPWWLGLTSEDRILTALPLFHLNAMVYSTLSAIYAGAPLILLERFSASTFWADAKRFGATEFNAIGAMVEILMRQPPSPHERDHKVRLCYSAPAPSESRHREIEERFGLDLIIGYGMSETPFGTIWPVSGSKPYATMGHLRQHPRLGTVNFARIVNEHGDEVASGQPGELLLQNPALMTGYFGQPEETARTLDGGWLHTGDVVRIDGEGNFIHVGRAKEMIRRRGENLAPAEIEAVLADHPQVSGAAVIGVPADLGEEDVLAFFTTDDSSRPTPETLREWCSSRLARQKVPSRFIQLDSLPMTPTGRIAKHELKRLWQENETRTTEGASI